jgi:hypothetical protein
VSAPLLLLLLLLPLVLPLLLLSLGSRPSCWCVSLCQADLRKLSFLWSEVLFEDVGEDGDDGDDFEDVSLFPCRVRQ